MSAQRLHIAVVGAGGVGGYIVGKLAHADLVDVTVIARGRQLEAIQTDGLKIIDTKDSFVTYPTAISSCEDTYYDVVFITTKSYDFQSACESIAPCIDEHTLIIPLSNGVSHTKALQRYLKTGLICEGCVYIISHIAQYGTIEKKSPLFYLLFGADKIDPTMQRLSNILNQSGLKTKLSDHIAYDCWKKYLFIASFATMTSYFQESMDAVMRNHPQTVHAVLAETKEVANALHIPINDEDVAKVIKQAKNLPENSKTSMQLDFEQGKKTELESLSGYIVKEAEKQGIVVKNMEKMYQKLLSLQS